MRTAHPLAAAPLLALVLAATACGEPAARKALRHEAHRTACIAEDMAIDAKVKLATIDTANVSAAGGPMEQLNHALHDYATAYRAYADARLAQLAWADSAAATKSSEDSARFAGMSQQARLPVPAPQSVQANVAEAYEKELRASLDNPDHPCNKEGGEDES
jgi:hypothetical protein